MNADPSHPLFKVTQAQEEKGKKCIEIIKGNVALQRYHETQEVLY